MPVVDSVEKYKGNTFKVEMSDGETYFWNIQTVTKYNLKAGISIPQQAVLEISEADQFRKARERALYLLDYRDYCFVELYKKLEQNYSEEICLRVVNNLAQAGIINDRRYAERLGEKLVCTKGYGYYRARQEMLMKGLDRELVEEILEEYSDETLQRLEELIEKKYAHRITDRKSLDRVKNALVRQGYSYSDINTVLADFDFEFEEEY